jgi:hypothetical protein
MSRPPGEQSVDGKRSFSRTEPERRDPARTALSSKGHIGCSAAVMMLFSTCAADHRPPRVRAGIFSGFTAQTKSSVSAEAVITTSIQRFSGFRCECAATTCELCR